MNKLRQFNEKMEARWERFNKKMEARWELFDRKMEEKYERFEEKANNFFNHKITRICIAFFALTACIMLILYWIMFFEDIKNNIKALGILGFCSISFFWITVRRVIEALKP